MALSCVSKLRINICILPKDLIVKDFSLVVFKIEMRRHSVLRSLGELNTFLELVRSPAVFFPLIYRALGVLSDEKTGGSGARLAVAFEF